MLPRVREQYEQFPYPPVNPGDERVRLFSQAHDCLDRMSFHCFGGALDISKPFRALAAGGGTGDATIFLAEQLRDTGEVVHVDLSDASIAIAQERAAIRGLKNIRWVRDSLLNLNAQAFGAFDYINCSGVLHHLADPETGLKALAGVLKPHGAMGIMLYATYGRKPVYMLQEALRRLTAVMPDYRDRIGAARDMLAALPKHHWWYAASSIFHDEVLSNEGLVDLLLHSQDRAYTVPQIYEFLGSSGFRPTVFLPGESRDMALNFALYEPETYLTNPEYALMLQAMPQPERQALAELLHGGMAKHSFYAMRNTPPAPPVPEDESCIPAFAVYLAASTKNDIIEAIRRSDEFVTMEQGSYNRKVIFYKLPWSEHIVSYIDGARSLAEIYNCVRNAAMESGGYVPDHGELALTFKVFYEGLRTQEWIFLRHGKVPSYFTLEQMQDRMKRLTN